MSVTFLAVGMDAERDVGWNGSDALAPAGSLVLRTGWKTETRYAMCVNISTKVSVVLIGADGKSMTCAETASTNQVCSSASLARISGSG